MSPINPRTVVAAVVSCVFTSMATAQVRDPFGAAVPGDPFAAPAVPEGDPVIVRFRVTDVSGKPVVGASIRGPGIRVRTVTNEEGKADWIATDNQLLQLSDNKTKPLRFKVSPPRGACMPDLTRLVQVQTLLRQEELEFQTRPGVELRGRAVGASDGQGIQGVVLYFAAKTASNPMRSGYYTVTNDKGEWSMVIPRVDSQIVAAGSVPGYKIGPERTYSTTVEIPTEVKSIDIPEFEIEQSQSRTVFVVVDGNEAMSNAQVEALYPIWPTDDFVMYESLSPKKSTDEEGRCFLEFKHADCTTAIIRATGQRNGVEYSGRTEIQLEETGPVEVRLLPPVTIIGTLTRGGEPAPGVQLVLYETLNVTRNSRDWFDVGKRGDAVTDEQGKFEFSAEPDVQYAIALNQRSDVGKQRVLHRTPKPVAGERHDLPQIDLETQSTH